MSVTRDSSKDCMEMGESLSDVHSTIEVTAKCVYAGCDRIGYCVGNRGVLPIICSRIVSTFAIIS